MKSSSQAMLCWQSIIHLFHFYFLWKILLWLNWIMEYNHEQYQYYGMMIFFDVGILWWKACIWYQTEHSLTKMWYSPMTDAANFSFWWQSDPQEWYYDMFILYSICHMECHGDLPVLIWGTSWWKAKREKKTKFSCMTSLLHSRVQQ